MDAWEERLYGNPNAVITELSTGKSVRVEVYSETRQEAEVIQKQFGGSVREVKMQNWVALDDVFRPPLKIRNAIVITGDRKIETKEALMREFPNRHIIQIPMEMAFGTGDHATTSTCLRLLVDLAKRQKGAWEMLDLGCGTAVLAIAARMMGAGACEAHDFDPQAVKVSTQNLELNDISHIKIREQDVLEWQPSKQWEVVVANMFSTILQKAFPTIVQAMKPRGSLIASGILAEQWEETRLSGEEAGLVFTKVVKKGKWITALGELCP